MASNDVFISYRRDVSGFLALALYQHITAAGIEVFYDIESLRAGQFDTIIVNQIEARPYFVLVLTPGTLNRCVEPRDWLRREIEHAIGAKRRIVLAHTPDFDFDDCERYLPLPTARELRRWQAQEMPHRWFKSAARELVEEYLVPVDDVVLAPTPEADAAVVERARASATAAPNVTTSQLTAQRHLERGLDHSEKGELERAIADYTLAIDLEPDHADSFVCRGAARKDAGDLDGAVADYERAIELDPDNAVAFNNRGAVRHERGDLDGAIADYSRAIDLDPSYAAPARNRGLARRAQG